MDFMGGLEQLTRGGPPATDTSEVIQISATALLKMLKHGRAGVPMEVMGLMLGSFVDDYTVRVVDVFAMPQSGTSITVESVDPVFQTKMMDMLKQVGRPEMVVGWYHSHPGFGCWLSNVDVNTQQAFEKLHERSVAVVVDPIQSVRGKVVIDAFRCIPQGVAMMGQEPRQTTSNDGHINKPSVQALVHGLNKHYYSLNIAYKKQEHENRILLNSHKAEWYAGLKLTEFKQHSKSNEASLQKMKELTPLYEKLIASGKDADEVDNIGKLNAKHRLEQEVQELHARAVNQLLGTAANANVF